MPQHHRKLLATSSSLLSIMSSKYTPSIYIPTYYTVLTIHPHIFVLFAFHCSFSLCLPISYRQLGEGNKLGRATFIYGSIACACACETKWFEKLLRSLCNKSQPMNGWRNIKKKKIIEQKLKRKRKNKGKIK